MSSLSMRHPDDGMLLRYIDGELPGRKARQVQRHLEACWKCRTEIEELQATVADCMHYRKNVLEAHLPQAPSPWADLLPGLSASTPLLRPNPSGRICSPERRRCGGVWPRPPPSRLFSRCGTSCRKRPRYRPPHSCSAPSRWRRNTPSQSAGIAFAAGVCRSSAAIAPSMALCRWRSPHASKRRITIPGIRSARAPSRRGEIRQAVKTDEVSTLPGSQAAGESYRIQTLVPTGDVASATLTLRATDLHPVDGKLEFRDRDCIEFTELTEPPAVGDEVPVAKNVEVPVRP